MPVFFFSFSFEAVQGRRGPFSIWLDAAVWSHEPPTPPAGEQPEREEPLSHVLSFLALGKLRGGDSGSGQTVEVSPDLISFESCANSENLCAASRLPSRLRKWIRKVSVSGQQSCSLHGPICSVPCRAHALQGNPKGALFF